MRIQCDRFTTPTGNLTDAQTSVGAGKRNKVRVKLSTHTLSSLAEVSVGQHIAHNLFYTANATMITSYRLQTNKCILK